MAEAKKNNKSDKSMFKYVPVYPQAPMDKKYHYYDGDVLKVNEDLCELVTDPKRLKEIFDSWEGKKIAIDTETTGLTFFQDFIVGFSVAADKDYGIYVPLRHQIRRTDKVKEVLTDPETGEPLLTKRGTKRTHTVEKHTDFDNPINMDVKTALDLLWDLMSKAKINVFFNLEFDLTMLKNEGYDVIKAGFPVFDTSIMTYLYDAENRNWNNLKACSAIVLGRKPTKFEEALGGAANFRYVDLSKGYPYAACDACHDEQTEVLTKNGWILWKNYDGITPLATPNLEKDCIEWQVPTRIIKYKYKGIMKHAITRNQDWMVTPNHSMLVYTAQNCTRPVLRKQADSLNFYEAMYTGPKSSANTAMDYTFGEYKLTEVDVARLTAMVLADGCTSHPSKENHQRKSVNIALSTCKNWDILKGFLDSLPFKNSKLYKCSSSSKTYQWNLFNTALWELLHESCGAGSANKYVPQFIKDMTAEGISEFVKFYSYCDGYTNYGAKGHLSTEICTVSTKMKDDLQELLTTIGIHNVSTFRPAKDSCIDGRPIKKENCKDQWLIYYKNSKTIGIKQTQIFDEMYDGFVYCAEVQNHTLVTRRNGRVLVSGNCNTIGIYETLGPEVRKLLGNATPTPIIIDGATKPYSVYHRDNELICAFTDYYHHVTLPINMETAKAYKKKAQEDLAKAEAEIYSYFDMGNFNLSTSSKDFKNAMVKAGIDTGLKTETGNVSYGKKGIENMTRKLRAFKDILRGFKYIDYDGDKINKRKSPNELKLVEFITFFGRDMFKFKDTVNFLQHIRTKEDIKMTKMEFFEELKLLYKRENQKLHILKVIQNRSSLAKAINSYIEKLATNESCHMHYNLKGTASGRLSSGNGSKNEKKKNHYFIDLNAQNLTKPTPAFYKARRSDEPGNIIGWMFDPVTEEYMHEHPDELIVEGFSPENNIRNCLVAPKGRYIASLDYSAQEYRAIAILSKDHKMIDNFKQGLDPHTATAYAVWGKEHYDKKKRKKAKGCNFLMSYCGGPKTLAENLDIPFEEAVDIIDGYNKAFFECVNWKKRTQKRVIEKQDGVIYSLFGRPRQFKSVLSTSFRLKAGTKEFASIPASERAYKGDAIYKAVERKIISHAVQGCLQGDVRILTNHGYIKIKELYNIVQENKMDESWLVYTGDHWAPFTVLNMGKAPAAKLALYGGETLNCDSRHEVFCHTLSTAKEPKAKTRKVVDLYSRKTQVCTMKPTEIEFESVLPATWVSTPKTGNARVVTINKEDHEMLWYWVGYFMGDGYWLGHYSDYKDYYKRGIGYCFGRHEEAKADNCISWFRKFGLNPTKHYRENNIGGKTINVVIHSAGYVQFLTDVIGVQIGCHFDTKRVPEILFRSPLSHRKAFIRGLMESDGYLKGGVLHMKNYELLRDVKLICSITGIATRLHSPENRKCGTTSLHLGAPYNGVGAKAAGTLSRRGKDTRYNGRSFKYCEVSDELVDTFTLTVFDDEHRFVSDEIISKNCCGDICRWDLIRLYRRFFKNRDPHIDFYSTVHDEINFSIDKDKIIEYVREIDDIMTIHNLSKDLPIVTSIDLGNTLGMLFPFEWEDETRTNLVPIKA